MAPGTHTSLLASPPPLCGAPVGHGASRIPQPSSSCAVPSRHPGVQVCPGCAGRAGASCRPHRSPESLLRPANASDRIEPAVLEMQECLGLLRKLAIGFPVHENWQLGTHVRFANCWFCLHAHLAPTGFFVAVFARLSLAPSSTSFSAVPRQQSACRREWYQMPGSVWVWSYLFLPGLILGVINTSCTKVQKCQTNRK